MEEKKRGRPAGKKLSADFYKKSAPQREDLALIAQGKIKLSAEVSKETACQEDTPVKPDSDSNLVGIGPNMTGRAKPEHDGTGGTPELTAQQAEALSKVCQTDELLDMMLRSLEQSGANPRWLDEAKISFSVGMMEVCRAILKPQGI